MTDRSAPGPFDVWAPIPGSVELLLGERVVEMRPGPRGWWTPVEPVAAVAGTDYGYRLDGQDPILPDPRSRWQPHGVHDRSRVFDATAYRWQDAHWTGRRLAGGVIYELHLGTFTPAGTLDAAISRLPHLVDLGVDFVELLPVNAFNGRHNWGYDGVLWYAVHDGYGGPAAYQRFVDACHRAGLAVIQDVVYNHLGPSGNYLPRFGPYQTTSTTTWGEATNLDGPGSDEVRRYVIDNALMWLRDYHVDGLRLDAVHALVDTTALPILEELSRAVDALSIAVRRPLSLIAESDRNDPRTVTAREAGGLGLTAQWNDDFHHALHANLTGETTGYYADFAGTRSLAKVLGRAFFHDGTHSSFRGRRHGRPVDLEHVGADRFVVFAQDHDQIGNRATGDRLAALVTDHDQLAIAAVCTLLSPFTPMLFMGEEWATSRPWQFFTAHPEPELAEATARGRVEEFRQVEWDPALVPHPQDPATYERSQLDWTELSRPGHADMLELYRFLIMLRRTHPGFVDPDLRAASARYGDGWLMLDRPTVFWAVNFADQPVELPAPARWQTVLARPAEPVITSATLRLPPHGVIVGVHDQDERVGS